MVDQIEKHELAAIALDNGVHRIGEGHSWDLRHQQLDHFDRVGLENRLVVIYDEPYNIARRFGSMDMICGGRAEARPVSRGI
jgi:hypothetical protein